MASTNGNPFYTVRSMNGINQISVINENITDLEQKLTNVSYNDLTNTTIILDNTQLFDVSLNNLVVNGTLTTSSGQSFLTPNSNATITGNWGFNNTIKINSNNLTLSSNGVMSFINDGSSAQVVDTVHNQSIAGYKTFTGTLDSDILITNSLTFPDGSTQTSANYLTPIQVNSTDRITATNSMETDIMTCNELYCDTISIASKIVEENDTGSTPKSFIYDANTMCHKDAVVNNTPLVVQVGHRVKSNGIGLVPFGDNGVTIATINSTNRSMTFSAGGFSLTIPPAANTNTLVAITGTSTFTSYNSLAGYTNFGIRGTGTSSNQPFVNSLTGLYSASTPTASLTYSPATKGGYINSNGRLISLDTYTNQNFISLTGVSNPTYTPSSFGTNEFNLLSRSTITPTANTGTFLAVPLSSTSLAYVTFGGANTDFITQLNNIVAGTKSTNNVTNGVLTLTISHTAATPTTTTRSGYVSGGTLKLESNPILATSLYVEGTASNGIPLLINSYITSVPTAPSSQYGIKQGTGSATLTNTTAVANIIGYIRFFSSRYWFISNSQPTTTHFLEGTGAPQATRMATPTAPYLGQTKIMELSNINPYTITATSAPFSPAGMVVSTTQVKLTSNPALTASYIFENASSFNSLIPNGTQIVSYNSTDQLITTTGLTAQTAVSTTLKGYMRTSTLLEIRGLGNSTPRINYFFTGSGIGANKNYVSVASSVTPYTLGASANTSTIATGAGLAGYTKFVNGTSFHLMLNDPEPFKTIDYFVNGGTLPENTGLSNNVTTVNNSIIVLADYTTYTTANVTVREPTIAVNATGYKAYPVGFNTYYVLENITLGATNYIEATRIDGTTGFASGLNGLIQRGTPNANNLFTTTIVGDTTITATTGIIFGGAVGGFYFSSKAVDNSVEDFIVNATNAPQTSVIYNSTTFDKGSQTSSKLLYRTAPVSSTPVVNANANVSYYIRSNSTLVSGFYDTEIFCKTATRITTLAFNQFFINSVTSSTFNNSVLNGTYINSFTQQATLGGFKVTLRGKDAATATANKASDTGIVQISTLVYRINTLGVYVPAVNDFIRVGSSTNINYITAVSFVVGTSYDITLAYTEGLAGVAVSFILTAPVTNTATLLQSSSFSGYEAQNLVVYTAGDVFTYYPSNLIYSMYSPLVFNFYNGVYSAITPQTYTIKTPITYAYRTPLTITDYGRTTFSFYNTETVTFFTFFDIFLPPNQAATTLVSIDAIQTLTNKTLTSPTINLITLQSSTTQSSTQLGYIFTSTLATGAIANNAVIGQYTNAPIGIWLVSFNFQVQSSPYTAGTFVFPNFSSQNFRFPFNSVGLSGTFVASGNFVYKNTAITTLGIQVFASVGGTITLLTGAPEGSFLTFTRIA